MIVVSQTVCASIDGSGWETEGICENTSHPPRLDLQLARRALAVLAHIAGGVIRPTRLTGCTYKDLNSNQGARFL